MKSRSLVQMRLSLEGETLWERLPRRTKEPSTDLLAQLLEAVLSIEGIEEARDEREADNRSS